MSRICLIILYMYFYAFCPNHKIRWCEIYKPTFTFSMKTKINEKCPSTALFPWWIINDDYKIIIIIHLFVPNIQYDEIKLRSEFHNWAKVRSSECRVWARKKSARASLLHAVQYILFAIVGVTAAQTSKITAMRAYTNVLLT